VTDHSTSSERQRLTRRAFITRAGAAAAAVQAAGLTLTLAPTARAESTGLTAMDQTRLRALLGALHPRLSGEEIAALTTDFAVESKGWDSASTDTVSEWLVAVDSLGGAGGLSARSVPERRKLIAEYLSNTYGQVVEAAPIYASARSDAQAIHTSRRGKASPVMTLTEMMDTSRRPRQPASVASPDPSPAQRRASDIQSALIMGKALVGRGAADGGNHVTSSPVSAGDLA